MPRSSGRRIRSESTYKEKKVSKCDKIRFQSIIVFEIV